MSATTLLDLSAPSPRPPSGAANLSPTDRQGVAIQALAGTEPVAELARQHQVSRKFVYQQADKAQQALEEIFDPAADGREVLFWLPVTKGWLRQLVLALALLGHASIRGIMELLQDLFDTSISVGTVHHILHQSVAQARQCQAHEDLSAIRAGAHDEIFQSRQPILVGCDVVSTYCYLLAQEEYRDATTWGVHLLELQARGLQLDHVLADGGKGLRAGQAEAWPAVPCWGDTFHLLSELQQVVSEAEHRAGATMTTRQQLEQKMQRAKSQQQGNTLSKKLALARKAETQAVALADELALLARWLQHDILAVVGPDLESRKALYEWLVQELQAREAFAPHRLQPLRKKLAKSREEVLAFAAQLDHQLATLAQHFQVAPHLVRALFEAQGIAETTPQRWEHEAVLRRQLADRFWLLQQALVELITTTVRASSVVENLNSRLRTYFFLRKHLGADYLDLLRFFLNHHRFLRSERPERQGQSPAELLTGQEHPHWLELLGFERFKKAA